MNDSRISMPVIPSPVNLFQDDRKLDQVLVNCQEQFIGNGCSRIVSFSQEIDPIEPLAVLREFVDTNQLHFYWENPRNQEAILGYGTVKFITIKSPDRFVQSQQFIHDCLQETINTGDMQLPGAGPHFFCSFTFFPYPLESDSPFSTATLFLPRFQIVKKNNRYLLTVNIATQENSDSSSTVDQIIQKIKKINWVNTKHGNNSNPEALNYSTDINSADQFKSSVTSALKSIDNGEFSKIVIAHALDIISGMNFDLVKSLYNLRQRHPDCYIFSVSNGQGSNFIGASPERLISIQNQQLVTDALAGSAPRGKTDLEDASFANRLLKSEKEKREHEAVTDFIMQRLCQLGLVPQKSPLKLLQLSNIQHLWTPIYAKVPSYIDPLNIVAQLHPTPAVAGVPTQFACEQIRRYEPFDRTLYAAPIGWVDHQGNSEFIVGIRSALIKGNHARLYAGAGIVAGSDPDQEFAEVQLKLQSLLKALI